jgi:hypothetical protein
MEIVFRSFCLDNFEHWQVFHDDAQILRFLNNLQEFSENQFNWQGEGEEEDDGEVKIEDLLDNKIPHGVVPLERMFNRHDMYKKKGRRST